MGGNPLFLVFMGEGCGFVQSSPAGAAGLGKHTRNVPTIHGRGVWGQNVPTKLKGVTAETKGTRAYT